MSAAEEDSPVCAFMKNPSMVDFPGHMAAVFFTSGCNFRCGFCHNAALLGQKQDALSWQDLERVCRRFAGDWVDAAVITGGEPTLSPRLVQLIRFFKKQGWAVKLDTNGSKPRQIAECLPLVNYVAMDVKTTLEGYPALTGCTDVDAVGASIRLIRDKAERYEFRTTLIEDLHDDAALREIGRLIEGAKRYVLQPFVPRANLPDPAFRIKQRTSPTFLERARALVAPHVEEAHIAGR